jgi:hypothetical protein
MRGGGTVFFAAHGRLLAGDAETGGNLMHEKVVSRPARALLADLGKIDDGALNGWTLAGGTGLALHFGHRVSDDFNLFRTRDMDAGAVLRVLAGLGPHEILQHEPDTLTVLVRKTKLSFFQVADAFLYPTIPYRLFALADVRDIALMKLAAIAGRGSRKDFVDLYFIVRRGFALQDFFDLLPKRFRSGSLDPYHILRGLTYFDDAEREPMPRVLQPFRWSECKAFFAREARAIVLGS